MYLKNNSSYVCGFRTKKEILTIKPNEAVFVLDSDLINVHSLLTRISEEEYFTIKRQMEQASLEKKETVPQDDKDEPSNEQKDTQVPSTETPSNIDTSTSKEVILQDNIVPSSDVEGKDDENAPKSELELLEERLEQLKAEWQNATRPAKKATITKQIKAIQEQIAKMK